MLTVKDLHKSYQVGKTTYEVLKGVSLEVDKGEFVAVMGPSGSGKTTLLNCISCYIPSDSGSILLGSQELARLDEEALARVRNRKLGFVFQDFLLLDGLTVRENILLPAIISGAVSAMTEARPTSCATCSASPPSAANTRRRSPAARSSAAPWPGRSSTTRWSFWPTSPRETWIPSPPGR